MMGIAPSAGEALLECGSSPAKMVYPASIMRRNIEQGGFAH
jgi:hypothetical protein